MCEGPHAYIPAAFVAKAEMIYTQLGERVENVLHFFKDGGYSVADLNQLGADIVASYPTSIADHQSGDAQLVLVRLTDLNSEFGPVVEYTTGLPLGGDQGAPIETGGTTVVTKFASDGRGRSRRGRAYNVGLPTSQIADNRVSDVWAQGITDDWKDFQTQMATLDATRAQVIVSYCEDGIWRAEALVSVISSVSTDVYIDSIRRRLHGRGQ